VQVFHVTTNTPPEDTAAASLYFRLKAKATGTPHNKLSRDAKKRKKNAEEHAHELPFSPGRDPRGLDAVLDNLTHELGWKAPLAQSDVIVGWPELVGPDIAARTIPLGISENVLTVQCESTAWATQLKLMSTDVLTKLIQTYPESGISAIRFQGPNAPSWKRGPKSIPGRGPRDTYG
jgi:predicted nucleic acid-binding Zn ribbon protein